MRRKMFLKITAIFLSTGTLTSSPVDFAYLLQYPISKCKFAKTLRPVLNKFLFEDNCFFFCHAHKVLGFGVGYQDGLYIFSLRPFYKQKTNASAFISLFKKSILGFNTFKQWRIERREEKRKEAETLERIREEQKRLAETPVPSLEEFADDFAMKETNFSSNEEKSYAYDSLKELIEELKRIQSSSGVYGPCEGQTMDFSKTLNNNIDELMCEANYYYRKMPGNDYFRLKLIESYDIFSKSTDRLGVLFYEEYHMNHDFFESPHGVAKKRFDYLINQIKHSHERMSNVIREKKAVISEEFKAFKEDKERLVGFIHGTCALIDHLNKKLACLNAKESYRLSDECPVSYKIDSAYSALGENARESVIAQKYRASIRAPYFAFVNIDKSYYLDALGPCEKLFSFYCQTKTIQK